MKTPEEIINTSFRRFQQSLKSYAKVKCAREIARQTSLRDRCTQTVWIIGEKGTVEYTYQNGIEVSMKEIPNKNQSGFISLHLIPVAYLDEC